MTIYGLPPIRREANASKSRPAGGSAFARALGSEPAADPAASAQAPAALFALLGLQEVETPLPSAISRAHLAEAGGSLLATLTDLQTSLLSGADPAEALMQLSIKLDSLPQPADEEGARLIGLLRVRAAVELARYARRDAP